MSTIATPRRRRANSGLVVLLGALAVMWIVEVVNAADGQRLDSDGIVAGSERGLIGIATAPFLHASFRHLMANSVPFLVLGGLILAASARELFAVLVTSTVTSGLAAWLLSPPHTIILGASGVVFGMLGFLLLRGVFTRNFGRILVAVVVATLFGSALVGLLPSGLPISWQGHLGGFIGGVLTARFLPWQRPHAPGSTRSGRQGA
jgi:membrane associated rhomboid family serine protease